MELSKSCLVVSRLFDVCVVFIACSFRLLVKRCCTCIRDLMCGKRQNDIFLCFFWSLWAVFPTMQYSNWICFSEVQHIFMCISWDITSLTLVEHSILAWLIRYCRCKPIPQSLGWGTSSRGHIFCAHQYLHEICYQLRDRLYWELGTLFFAVLTVNLTTYAHPQHDYS